MNTEQPKKKIAKFSLAAAIIFSIIPLSSCVYDREFAYLNDQIIVLKRQVTKIEGSINAKLENDLNSKLASIRSNQSGIGVEIDQLRGEVKELSGRIEENEHLTKRAIERDLSEQDAIAVMLEAHNTGVGLVIVCDLEPAEFYCETLKAKGLTSTIEPDH